MKSGLRTGNPLPSAILLRNKLEVTESLLGSFISGRLRPAKATKHSITYTLARTNSSLFDKLYRAGRTVVPGRWAIREKLC